MSALLNNIPVMLAAYLPAWMAMLKPACLRAWLAGWLAGYVEVWLCLGVGSLYEDVNLRDVDTKNLLFSALSIISTFTTLSVVRLLLSVMYSAVHR